MADPSTKTDTENPRWMQQSPPFWWPDGQGFVIAAVVVYAGIALFYRMTHPAEINDKLLDMMLTILYGTAFVGILNFVIGSSRSSQTKDVSTNKIVEKLTSSAPPATGPVSPVAAPSVVVSWWSLLTPIEQAAIEAAQDTDARIKEILTALQSGKAEAPDINDLVAKGLLTQARASIIIGV